MKRRPGPPPKPEHTFDEGMLRRFLAAKADPEIGLPELRALHADWSRSGNMIVPADRYSKTIRGWYDDPNALVVDAKSFRGVSAYLTVNLANPALLGRAANRLKVAKQGEATSDAEIVNLRYLYLDCDSKRPDGISATQAELDAAIDLRDRVLADVPGLAASAIWGCSGNGGWIQIRLPDYPNDAAHIEHCRTFLNLLAKRFNTDRAHVDVKTHNPSRIAALPGTLKCKGEHLEDRPWRLVTLETPDEVGAAVAPDRQVAFDLIGWAAENAELQGTRPSTAIAVSPPSTTTDTTSQTTTAPAAQSKRPSPVERARLVIFAPGFPDAVAGRDGHKVLFRAASVLINNFALSDADGFPLFQEWNQAKAIPPESDKQIRHKWESVRNRYPNPSGDLVNADRPFEVGTPEVPRPSYEGANDHVHAPLIDPLTGKPVIEGPDDPHRLARVIRAAYLDTDSRCRLAYYRGDFYIHQGSQYHIDERFRAVELVNRVKRELDFQFELAHAQWKELPKDIRGKEPCAIKVTTRLTGDVTQALIAMTNVSSDREAPFWRFRDEDDPNQPVPVNVIPVANGLLDVGADPPRLLDHTPNFFCVHSLPYAYDPDAPTPERWSRLLADQWPNDAESIDTLHEQLGYLLTPDNSQERIFLWIGPPRSGRSTMKNILIHLVGSPNVAATSAVALGSPHGLESLLNKTVAILGDARTSDTHDTAIMIDRLLRISGNDPVEVNPKGKRILSNVKLSVRFVVISNELPLLRDASNAITSRYLILKTSRTIPPEDRVSGLADKIIAHELPGILNLAIAGLKRLRLRRRFVQPASARDLLDDAEEIASPTQTFVQECLFVDPDVDMPTADAWSLWRSWAFSNGYQPGNMATFGKNLKAACPMVRKSRPRDADSAIHARPSKQVPTYIGITPSESGLERLNRLRTRQMQENGLGGFRNGAGNGHGNGPTNGLPLLGFDTSAANLRVDQEDQEDGAEKLMERYEARDDE